MNARIAHTRFLPILGAGLLLASILLIGAIGSVGAGGEDASFSGSEGVPVPEPDLPPITTGSAVTGPAVSVLAVPEATTTTLPAPDATLGLGSSGDDVRRLQQRLAELGFVPGGDDGYFGELTQQAVWAFEKLILGTDRADVTGVVTADTWRRLMDSDTVVAPRRSNAGTTNHTEIYLPEQVLAVFHAQQPVFVAHMSHGTGDEWCKEVSISPGEYGNEDGVDPLHVGRCGVSNTPGGVFEHHRMVDGHRDSALGGMLNPVYFNYGIAVHGAYNVPNHPASHGCIRIPNVLSSSYQSLVGIGERVYVWDGEHEPEHYGEQLPTFDWRWDEYEPRATTTTTTTPVTTTTTLPTESTTTTTTTTTTSPETTTTTTTASETTTPTTTVATVPATSASTTAPETTSTIVDDEALLAGQ